MKSSFHNKSSLNSQKSLYNFFSVQNDITKEIMCSSCGKNFPVSKITWHRDFECMNNSTKTATVKSHNNRKRKAKKTKSKDTCQEWNIDKVVPQDYLEVVLLDSESDEEFSPQNLSKRCCSPPLFKLENVCDDIKDLEEKGSVIESLKRDWDTPVKPENVSSNDSEKSDLLHPLSGAKSRTFMKSSSDDVKNIVEINSCDNLEICKPFIKKKKKENDDSTEENCIDTSDFSTISENNSDDDFENNKIIFNSPSNERHKCTSHSRSSSSTKMKVVGSSPLSSKSSKCKVPDESKSLSPKKKVCSDISNYSYEQSVIHSPCLVSPNRTPTPSPQSSLEEKSSSKLNLSTVVSNSPHKFSLEAKLQSYKDDGIEINASQSVSKYRQIPGLKNSIKKTTLENGYIPSSSGIISIRRDLSSTFERISADVSSSPLKTKSSPVKYRNEKGMYLENFLCIVDAVTSQPEDLDLFNENDLKTISTFNTLSLAAQKLYVRLFQRKIKWNKASKIDYKEICDKDDIVMYINELTYAGFLISEDTLINLKDILFLLDVNEVKKVCKEMKISCIGTKETLINRLIKSNSQQKTILASFGKVDRNDSPLFKMAKSLAGRCFIVNKEYWSVFMRVLQLYSPARFDEDEENGQQSQLITLLMVSIGKMKFPKYNVQRTHKIYRSRDDLIQFQSCLQLEYEVQECLKNQNWQAAEVLCKQAEELYLELQDDKELQLHDASLPRFLRRFTVLSLVCHVRSLAVEIYQRTKHYGKAVKLLEQLLAQKTHLQDYRGRWYDRLALNLHHHLNKAVKSLRVIQEALEDPEVRVGHRLALSQRAEKLLNSKSSNKFASDFEGKINIMTFDEAPKVYIQGKSLSSDVSGYKRVFISGDDKEGVVCSVEELVLLHYQKEGYPKGLHCEGRSAAALFGFFMWDILYMPVPDAFRCPHQAAPLDLDTPDFYKSRKLEIDKRLKRMEKWSLEKAFKIMQKVWNENLNNVCLIDWKMFSSLEFAQGFVAGLGMTLITSICRRLALDHRFTRSGFPDLIVWNPESKTSRIVEVKGPNDKLSTKQILWLEYLLKNGASAEVCHVEAVGQKRTGALKSRRISPRTSLVENSEEMNQRIDIDPSKTMKRKR